MNCIYCGCMLVSFDETMRHIRGIHPEVNFKAPTEKERKSLTIMFVEERLRAFII